MAVTHHAGPLYISGQAAYADFNSTRGPSLFDQGLGLMDPRVPFAYSPGTRADMPTYGWLGVTGIPVISQVPSTLAATNIAASQTPTASTPLTLVSATGAGITAGVSITRADTGATVTGLLAIDGAMGSVAFGQGAGSGGPTTLWDPTKAISRAVRVVSVGNDSTATFLISGYDIYGFPMSQLLTGANAGTATTTKCFKYIASVLPVGTLSGSAVTVGTTDTYGLPLRADDYGSVDIVWNATSITASTGFTAAVTTTPATTITGDVRGSYAVQSASDGTKKLLVFVTPSVANIGSAVGLTGVTQV